MFFKFFTHVPEEERQKGHGNYTICEDTPQAARGITRTQAKTKDSAQENSHKDEAKTHQGRTKDEARTQPKKTRTKDEARTQSKKTHTQGRSKDEVRAKSAKVVYDIPQ